MKKFAKIPPARLQWEGVGYYNGGYATMQDYEFTLTRVAKDQITIGEGTVLDYAQAYELYQDLVSAQLAVVIQRGARTHAVTVQTAVQVLIPGEDDDTEVPRHLIEEVTAWLRHVLDVTPYTGDPETWEY